MAVSVSIDLIAEALPGYEVGRELGRGAYGIVLEGMHKQLGRRVAIKQLPTQFVNEETRARFVNEARLLASLDHPHIVPIFDYVEKEGLALLVMEHLPGGTVWDRFQSTGYTPDAACAVIAATCAGLHFAHERGVLHRDVKPENLIFNAAGILKVTDFGIAKVVGGDNALATRAGEVLGTPAYMAPEQATAKEIGAPADIYAAGTMLYELLSGQLPFPDETEALALIFQHVHGTPVPLRQLAPQVSESLERVTMKAIATNPEDRYKTAEEFGTAVAEAGTEIWGPGWLERSGVNVMAAGPILAAAERPTLTQTAQAQIAAADLTPPPPAQFVRPTRSVKPQGVGLLGVNPEEVESLENAIEVAPPGFPLLASVGLLLLAILFSFLSLGAPTSGGDLAPGALTLGGADPAMADRLPLDISGSVAVRVTDTAITSVKLSLNPAPVPRISASEPVEAGESELDVGYGKFLVAPSTIATVEAGGRSRTFMAETGVSMFATAWFYLGIALLLFALAYLESLLKPLRRGRGRMGSFARLIGLALVGLLGGVGVSLLVWTVLGRLPTQLSLILSAISVAAASVAAGVFAIRYGKAQRLQRAAERRRPAGQRLKAAA